MGETENIINNIRMNEFDFKSRIKEIKKLIADGLTDQASGLLMDLCDEFQTDKEHKNEALGIKSKWSKFNKDNRNGTIKSDESEIKYAKLIKQMLELLDSIEKIKHIKIQEIVIKKEITHEEGNIVNNITENTLANNVEEKSEIKNEDRKLFFKAENIEKKYEEFNLSPISFELKAGEITCVIGENGSGKTTLLKIIGGILKYDLGNISYPDLDTVGWYSIKQNIAYLPDVNDGWQYGINTFLKFMASVHGYTEQENAKRVNEIITRLGLEEYKDHKYSDLSSGYQMRFDLARAMVWQPKILILDEPLAHLDVNAQQIFLRDLRNFVNSTQHQLTVVISSQHIYEIENISDNVIALEKGKVIFNDKISKIKNRNKQNTFEIGCNFSVEELYKIMIKKDKSIKVYPVGIYMFIDTSLEFTVQDLLRIFSEHDINLFYLRDISNSARKILNH